MIENLEELKKLFSYRIEKNINGCWYWIGSLTSNGFPRLHFNKKEFSGHRLSYLMYVGKIDQRTTIRRNCANNLCVNPKHLYIEEMGKWNIEFNSLADAYNELVIKNDFGCWGWRRKIDRYARLNYNGKCYGAHRASYIIYFGSIPEGKEILHKCNNKVCSNPDHLYAGNNRSNMNDIIVDNISYKKLSNQEIIKIKSLNKQNIKHKKIAELFNINIKTVLLIIHNRFPFEKYKDLEF